MDKATLLAAAATVVSDPTRANGEVFINACCEIIGGGFHPDDSFSNYVTVDDEDGLPRCFTDEEAADLDAAMAATFLVVDDPYEVGLNHPVFVELMGGS